MSEVDSVFGVAGVKPETRAKKASHPLVNSLNKSISNAEKNIVFWTERGVRGNASTGSYTIKNDGRFLIKLKIGTSIFHKLDNVIEDDVEKALGNGLKFLQDRLADVQANGGITDTSSPVTQEMIKLHKDNTEPGGRKIDPKEYKPADKGGMSIWDDKTTQWIKPIKNSDGSFSMP